MRILTKMLCLIGAILVFSCASKNGSSLNAYRQWMDDGHHGVLIAKQVGDVKLALQWLPPELLAYQDFHNDNILCDKHLRDSVMDQYRKSLSFLLTVESVDQKQDILWKNIATQEEFKERVHQLNFRMNEFIRLEADGQVYSPVLHLLENDYGIAHARKIHLVFADAEQNGKMHGAQQYKLVFDDALFMTGISNFVFERKNMDAVPAVGFWNCNDKKI